MIAASLPTTTALDLSTTIADAIDTSTPTPSVTFAGVSEALPTGTSMVSSTAAASSGLSSGATAGLAGAGSAIAIIALVAGIFIFRRKSQRKRQERYGKMDEKTAAAHTSVGSGGGSSGSGGYTVPIVSVSQFNDRPGPSYTQPQAPQVSLRPVTEFNPNLAGSSAGAGAAAAMAGAAAQKQQGQQAQAPRQPTPGTSMSRSLSRKEPPPALVLSKPNDITPVVQEKPVVAPYQPLSVRPPSLTPSAFTDASAAVSPFAGEAAAVAAVATPPASGAVASVHRVQMDFIPSMADELELRGGQLVRIVHEYDDGWALCIRLDRSQQGVCPRTCLSQRPVKPRQGPAPGTPVSASPRPGFPIVTPQSATASSPVTGRNSPLESPIVPAVRSQSPVQHIHSSVILSSTVTRPQSPALYTPPSHPQSPAIRTGSPGGYYKPQYRPASGSPSRPQSSMLSPSRPQSSALSPSRPQSSAQSPVAVPGTFRSSNTSCSRARRAWLTAWKSCTCFTPPRKKKTGN